MGWRFRRKEHDEEQLSAYLDGELSARQTENVERHLSTCEECAALLEELRRTRSLLSALPAHTPRRSFVLGAEYARSPAREVAASPRRLGLALAPAIALSVFVALLFVDLAGFSSGSSDDGAATFIAASSRQAADTAENGTAGSIGSAPPVPDAATGKASEAETPPAMAPEAAGAGSAATGDLGPAGLSPALPAVTPPAAGPAAAGITAAEPSPGEEPSPETVGFEAPEHESNDGISTVRILEIVAGAAFLASGFYVFVWPRLSRGGS